MLVRDRQEEQAREFTGSNIGNIGGPPLLFTVAIFMLPFLTRILGNLNRRRPSKVIDLVADQAGVAVVYEGQPPEKLFRWEDVEEIRTFKLDCFTVDDIRLAVRAEGLWHEFSEGCPGFFALTNGMRTAFPCIPEKWYWEVMLPPFATNERVLYRRP